MMTYWAAVEAIATVCTFAVAFYVGILTIIFAILGYGGWKRQVKGKTEYALARRTLQAVYTFNSALLYARRQRSKEELRTALREDGHVYNENLAVEEYPIDWIESIFKRRFHYANGVKKECDVVFFEAAAVWGSEARKLLNKIDWLGTKYAKYVNRYMELYRRDRNQEEQEEFVKLEEILFITLAPNDTFTKEALKDIKEIENYFLRYLQI